MGMTCLSAKPRHTFRRCTGTVRCRRETPEQNFRFCHLPLYSILSVRKGKMKSCARRLSLFQQMLRQQHVKLAVVIRDVYHNKTEKKSLNTASLVELFVASKDAWPFMIQHEMKNQMFEQVPT